MKFLPERKIFVALLAAFTLTAGISGFLAVRLAVRTIYWSSHQDEPIEEWMPLGYVANSHGVSPILLQTALGLPAGVRDRSPLGEIARKQGKSFAEVRRTLEEAIAAKRNQDIEPGRNPAGQ
ncbi:MULTISPECIES: hypothetical protein [Neorhizobium]|jgi:hypothetical protein|uniref:hypothetical protein n=1 Tax=Neorhizobium TaxID=1525371 RepID=UPI000CFA4BEE|nr:MULTISPECIES: hypothetical protein [Neorhizobium]